MKFGVRSVAPEEFERWLTTAVRASPEQLTRERYLELARPSEREPRRYFASVDQRLFDYVLGDCVQAGRLCSHDMADIDRRGGLGKAGIYNVASSPEGEYLMGLCKLPTLTAFDDILRPADHSPLLGAGLPLPRSGRDTPLLAGAERP
jgi:cytochrome o ubiquinol oxidase subunit 2